MKAGKAEKLGKFCESETVLFDIWHIIWGNSFTIFKEYLYFYFLICYLKYSINQEIINQIKYTQIYLWLNARVLKWDYGEELARL